MWYAEVPKVVLGSMAIVQSQSSRCGVTPLEMFLYRTALSGVALPAHSQMFNRPAGLEIVREDELLLTHRCSVLRSSEGGGAVVTLGLSFPQEPWALKILDSLGLSQATGNYARYFGFLLWL